MDKMYYHRVIEVRRESSCDRSISIYEKKLFEKGKEEWHQCFNIQKILFKFVKTLHYIHNKED